MLDFGPTAFQRSGTPAPVLCSVTATSLSSRARGGQQNKPRNTNPCFWRWPACRDRGDCPPNPGSKASSYADGTRAPIIAAHKTASRFGASNPERPVLLGSRMDESSLLRSLAARAPTHELAGSCHLAAASSRGRRARPQRMATCRTASRPTPGVERRGAGRQARLHRPGLDTDQRTRQPAPATRKSGPQAGAGGLQGHAGQRGAVSQQLVLDLEIAGGGVCRAGLLVIEVAARHPRVRIRADGQPCLGHRGE